MDTRETFEANKDRADWKKYFQIPIIVIAIAIATSLPVSILSALLYRFPFFMVGHVHGISAAIATPTMWAILIVSGGFIVLGILGFIAGLVIAIRIHDNTLRKKYAIRTGVLIAIISVLIFASSDLIFGTW